MKHFSIASTYMKEANGSKLKYYVILYKRGCLYSGVDLKRAKQACLEVLRHDHVINGYTDKLIVCISIATWDKDHKWWTPGKTQQVWVHENNAWNTLH